MMSQSPLGSQPMSDFLCLAFLYALALKHMQAGISLWFWTFILQMIAALTCSYSQPEAEATFLFIARHHASVVCNSSCLFSWKKESESSSRAKIHYSWADFTLGTGTLRSLTNTRSKDNVTCQCNTLPRNAEKTVIDVHFLSDSEWLLAHCIHMWP